MLDDNSLIRNNPYIKKIQPITSYLVQEDGITDSRDSSIYHTGYYRPLVNVTYWLDYKLWGMSAQGFRTTNLILHVLTCFLLFKVLVFLVNDRQACFLATALFALHPVNTESISLIVSRNNILVTIFSIASFYFYLKGFRNDSYIDKSLAMLFFVAAILSKEFGLMILPVFFLYHRLLSKEKGNVSKELISYLPFLLILIFYFTVRKGVTDSLLTPSDMEHVWSRIYFSPYLILLSLRLIFFPHELHSFALSYPPTIFNWPAIISIVLFLLIGTALWIARKNKLLVFSGLSFLVAIFPVLNIIPTASISLVAMRWLYFPFVFISVSAAWGIQKAIVRRKMLTTSLVCVFMCYLGVYSYILNKSLWHDEDSFFTQEVKGFNNYLYAGGFAESLFDKRNYQEAEKYFRIAIKNYPHQAKSYINYSAMLIETGRMNEALLFLNNAKPLTMIHSERGEWFNNLGMLDFKLGKREEAIRNFKEAVFFNPNEPLFWANLGGAYGSKGDYESSLIALKKGLEIGPDSLTIKKNLAVTYIRMREYEKAIFVLEGISPKERAEMGISNLLLKAQRAHALHKGVSESKTGKE
jgi:Flp pilus assembly protein TadD/uncharacterized integral membrane protein